MSTLINGANALPYIRFNGVELNGAMPWEYILKGLIGAGGQIVNGAVPAAVLYEDPITAAPRTFVSPAADPAPWYDAAFPESANFLGIYIEEIVGLDSTGIRNPQTRISGLGGGVLGPLRFKERRMDFKATVFASNQAGMEYGERWLTDVFLGNAEQPCLPVDLDVRTAVPPAGFDHNTSRWTIRNVGIVAGPSWAPHPISGLSCQMRSLTFSITSEFPHLFKPTTPLVANTVLLPTAPACTPFCTWWTDYRSVSTTLTCTPKTGENTAVITLTAGSQPCSFRIIGRTKSGACVPVDPHAPDDATYLFDVGVSGLPAGTTLIYDASIREIIAIDSHGTRYDGTRYLVLQTDQGIDWPTARWDSPICLDVVVTMCSLNTTTAVKIDTVYRAL